jgi:hypothetical protein
MLSGGSGNILHIGQEGKILTQEEYNVYIIALVFISIAGILILISIGFIAHAIRKNYIAHYKKRK